MAPTFAKLTLLLVLVTFTATAPLAYFDWRVVESPLVAEVVSGNLEGLQSVATDRTAGSVRRAFATEDWIERRYTTEAGEPVTLFVVRSYDMKRLYHHPELAIVRGLDLMSEGAQTVSSHSGPVDVHLLRGRAGTGAAAYALLYRNHTVLNPLTFQVRTAVDALLSGRRPMTLVFALAPEHAEADDDPSPALPIVLAAVDALRDVHR